MLRVLLPFLALVSLAGATLQAETAAIVDVDMTDTELPCVSKHLVVSNAMADSVATWQQNGVPVVTASYDQDETVVVPDGYGGIIAAWTDNRNQGPLAVYIQRLNADGAALWATNGIQVPGANPGTEHRPALFLDELGGFYVFWEQSVSGVETIQVTRFMLDGNLAPGWTASGIPLCQSPDCRNSLGETQITSDDQGGVFASWVTLLSVKNCYLQRVTPQAMIAASWPADGLLVSEDASEYERIAPDGQGGVFIVWRSQTLNRLYLQRYTASHQVAVGWPAAGLALGQINTSQANPSMIPDGSGGVVVIWDDYRFGVNSIRASRIQADGSRAPGWDVAGNPLCSDCSSNSQIWGGRMIASDGDGGAYFAWQYLGYHAQRINSAGTVPAGWPANGFVLDTWTLGQAAVAPDGFGGAVVTWAGEEGLGYAQHLDANGSFDANFPTSGLILSGYGTYWPRPVLAEPGVVIAVWEDYRDYLTLNELDVYAQRLLVGAAPTDVGDFADPRALRSRVWPNPFRDSVELAFDISQQRVVRVDVFDVTGRRIRGLMHADLLPGSYHVQWDGKDGYGTKQAAGLYLMRVETSGKSALRKVLLAH